MKFKMYNCLFKKGLFGIKKIANQFGFCEDCYRVESKKVKCHILGFCIDKCVCEECADERGFIYNEEAGQYVYKKEKNDAEG